MNLLRIDDELAERGILIRSPDAYKDVSAVVGVADKPGLARKVAKLAPLVCVKG